ncbi:MAG: DNA repair protein RecO [Bdellovibrionaceae bacterium]|nr:DNA repair protein RecO [Pseudobdellovibrionaceae bacterium]
MLVKEKIIILKNQAFSESDLIVWGLNQKGWQLSFIAKGALKSKKRFSGGVLEPSSYIQVEYQQSKSSLHKLQQAWFLDSFSKLRTSYQRLNLALYFLGIVYKVSQQGTEDTKELFNLLGNALKQTETSPQLKNLKICFQIKFLFGQGVLPKELSLKSALNKTLSEHVEINWSESEQQFLSNKLDHSLKNYLE